MTKSRMVVALVLLSTLFGVKAAPIFTQIDVMITELNSGTLQKGKTELFFSLRLSRPIDEPVTFVLESENHKVAYPLQTSVTFQKENSTIPQKIYVHAQGIGDTEIKVKYNDSHITHPTQDHDTIKVLVVHSVPLKYITFVIGWIYFFAWAISNYPQVYINYKRKSVVGLNFDYLSYNLTGFACYSIFNVALYCVHVVQQQYFAKFGGSVIPVQINDVFFGVHNTFITAVCIFQACIYDRGGQRVSRLCNVVVAVMWVFLAASLAPAIMHKVTWLMYLNFFSYIKLVITIIKYIPQVYMNYLRQSTAGWSIIFVVLDLMGGTFSLLQMLLVAYNNDEWNSMFGDFTKLGLGLLTLIFDAIFLVQHYILYRDPGFTSKPFPEEIEDEKL